MRTFLNQHGNYVILDNKKSLAYIKDGDAVVPPLLAFIKFQKLTR